MVQMTTQLYKKVVILKNNFKCIIKLYIYIYKEKRYWLIMNINQEINTTRENCSFYTEIYLIKHKR